MRHFYFLFLISLLLPLGAWAQAEQTVSGTVQAESGMALPGATVFLKGTYNGTSTNEEGQFQLKANFAKPPVILVVSFVGYESQEFPLSQPDNALQLVLKPSAMLDQVVVAASRVEESIGQVPVTIEKITSRQVEQLTTPDVIAGLARFKAVDISASSMLISSFSTRGFNSSRAERVLQLADYMDTQLPSLSSNFGNLLGIPVLDIDNMELLHGPASALYGANAFNGVLLFNSKDPFVSPGLTVRLRGGNRNMRDAQLRYAVKIGQRLAFKIAGGVTTADDFIPENQDASSTLIEPLNNPAGFVTGYDAVSRYGDVGVYTFGSTFTNPSNGQQVATPAGLVGKTLFLPGYSERDLLGGDTKTQSFKVAPSLSYLLSNSVKLTLDYKWTAGDAAFQQAARYYFKNSGAHQGRIEVKGRNWFVRTFSTIDYSGGRDPKTDGGYNLGVLGGLMATQIKPGFMVPVINPQTGMPTGTRPGVYAESYVGTYLGTLAAGAPATVAAANAAGALIQPGTETFSTTRDKIVHDASVSASGQAQGARIILRSILSDVSGQYTFRPAFADITVGGAYRQYNLGSDGTVFGDKDQDRIKNYEYGAYGQITKSMLDDRLKAAVAVRVDEFRNFNPAVSPRASLVYSAGADKQHNFRAAYSRAFRSPTQTDQYIRFDVGRAIILGNAKSGFDGYSTKVLSGQPLSQSQLHIDNLRLEEVNTVEVGYRAQLSKKLYADLTYFRSNYNDFIGTQTFVGNLNGSLPAPTDLATVATPGSQTRIIQLAANVNQQVETQGASIGLSYTVAPALTLVGNYSYNEFLTTDLPVGFQTFFNTAKHKFNLGFDGQALNRKLSYNVNYRWTDAFLYEATFATGSVPVSKVVDAQLGYTLSGLHTTIQVGGTNLFDDQNLQVYGAANYGRLVYAGLLFDLK
jgi:iron complex outermembrane receptor protein